MDKKEYILLLLLSLLCRMQGEDGQTICCRPLVMLYEGIMTKETSSSDDLKTGRVKARRCRPQIPTVRGDSGRRKSLTSNRKRSFICSTPADFPSGSEADMG